MAAAEAAVAAVADGMEQMSIEDQIRAAQDNVTRQGDVVRALKAKAASQEEVSANIEKLKFAKQDLDKLLQAFKEKKGSTLNKEKFRSDVNNALERRLFYIPAFKIYGGISGLYDYGPPGCAVKSNVVQFWRQHFIMEENMLEIECTNVTPEVVLKASGHVDKFTDLMVRDVVTLACHRADHLLKAVLEEKLEDPLLDPALREEYRDVLARVDDFDGPGLGALLKKYGVKAPDTGNDICEPFDFNLMFGTQIGPTGQLQGYLRPETAQGMFVNFRDLLYYNGGRLPFAAAQIGQAFRNEINPRAGLLRVREFQLAEIEHFVNPEDKSHPRFSQVADLKFRLYPRKEQLGPKETVDMRLGDAVADGTIANETLGYFIGRTYLFLKAIGIDCSRLRFRQHLQHEMAHYACDCWDAEIECSYGWIECVGLADRSAYDLEAHTTKSKVDLSAYLAFPEPVEVEEVAVTLNRKEIGSTFKKDSKLVCEAIEALSDEEKNAFEEDLKAKGEATLTLCTTDQSFTILRSMVQIDKRVVKRAGKNIIPSVIEPSFGIGRIIYCLYEHSFYVRDGDENRTVFAFRPVVAPAKVVVLPLSSDATMNKTCAEISQLLTKAGVSNKVDNTSASIGKRYARSDEIGVPFGVTVDFETQSDLSVTLRERDSTEQIRIPLDKLAEQVAMLAKEEATWAEVKAVFPLQAPASAT